MSVKSTHGRSMTDPERNREIDLALAVMCALQVPGQIVPYSAIAEVTGLSHGGPFMIEQSALKKIRNRVLFGKEAAAFREVR